MTSGREARLHKALAKAIGSRIKTRNDDVDKINEYLLQKDVITLNQWQQKWEFHDVYKHLEKVDRISVGNYEYLIKMFHDLDMHTYAKLAEKWQGHCRSGCDPTLRQRDQNGQTYNAPTQRQVGNASGLGSIANLIVKGDPGVTVNITTNIYANKTNEEDENVLPFE